MNKIGIEDCHRLRKADPKSTIVQFVNRKFCYEALDKKLNLRKVDSTKLGFQADTVLYFSKNLTRCNQRLAWKCRELKRASEIQSNWSSKGIVKLRHTMNERPISIMHHSDITSLAFNSKLEAVQYKGSISDYRSYSRYIKDKSLSGYRT